MNNVQLSARARPNEKADLGVSWVTNFDPQTGETTGNQLRLGTIFNVFRSRWLFQSSVNYDLEQSLLQQASQIVQYTSQCWALRLEFRRFESEQRGEDQDIRLALSLNNIGTFLDLNSSTRENGNQGFF